MINSKKLTVLFVLFVSLSSYSQAKKWTLRECVDYALKNNISIQQSELDVKLTQVSKSDAIGNFLPNINANSSHSWNIGLNQNITTGLLENQTTQFTSAGLNSNVAIYNGLQNQNRLRKANLSLLASQFQLAKMKDDVSLNIANSFLQILFNKESLKVQKDQLSVDEKQLSRTQSLVEAGMIARGDLLDVQATVASDKQRIIAAENVLFLSKLGLAQLLQLNDYQNFDIEDSNQLTVQNTTVLDNPAAVVEKAKADRVELKIAKTNLEIAEKDIKIAKGAYQPSVSGFYSFSTRASYSDRVIGLDTSGSPILAPPLPLFDQFSNNKGHNFGLQLSIPIFNGFAVKNSVERAKLSFERSKIASKTAELDLERNVYTAISDAKGAINAHEAAVIAMNARKEAMNYAKEKYEVGLLNSFDYNQAQTLYTNAQSEVVRTKYDAIFKIKVVEFYFGIPLSEM
ncbi:MAG: TolC family protein [Flavobacterium sp.]|jgi:outer membrane protein|nr:TolC family protein [Flavobacterium sp.]MBP6099178.1 TolC family protein [Flavobacterium sp.]